MRFSQSCRVMLSNAGELIGRGKPDMDSSLDRLKRPQVWVCILGIVLLASGVGNSGEERCIFGHVFPEGHAYYNSALKRPSSYSILKLKRPPLWGPILSMETLSQPSVAGNMSESAWLDDKGIAFFYSAKLDGFDEFRLKGQLPACSWSGSLQVEFKEYAHGLDKLGLKGQPPAFSGVSSFQARFKERGQGQSSSRSAEGSGARNVNEQRTESRVGNSGRLGRDIGRIGGDGQRRDNGDDDDNRHRMVGDVDNGRGPRNPRRDEIVEIYLPIVVQTLTALLQIDDAQLSDTDRLIRCFAVMTNLLAFLCCLFVIRQPNMNQGNARILFLSRMIRIASALSVMGFVPILAINLPLNLRWLVFLAFLAVVAMFWVDIS